MKSAKPGALQDAMLITAAQKVEHYEIATYGTARTYAQVVGERAVARLLEQTLKEEKDTDKKLTRIAEGSINKRAGEEWQGRSAGRLERGTRWAGAAMGSAVKRVRPHAQAADRGPWNTRRSNARSRRTRSR